MDIKEKIIKEIDSLYSQGEWGQIDSTEKVFQKLKKLYKKLESLK